MLVYLNLALAHQKELATEANKSFTVEDLRQAIIAGALQRIRPIMMTISTILFGLLTVMLATGTGSEVMRRIATPMVGGIISTTILTLVVIPAIFLVVHTARLNKDGIH